MKAKQLLWFSGIMALGLAACMLAEDQHGQANLTPPKQQRPGSTLTNLAAASDFPVIVYLERRGQTITVKAGRKGPVYSIKTAEGKTLFENLSTEQLRAQAPELQEFIKTALASGSGNSGAGIDASLRLR
jgi:hypothetical protein